MWGGGVASGPDVTSRSRLALHFGVFNFQWCNRLDCRASAGRNLLHFWLKKFEKLFLTVGSPSFLFTDCLLKRNPDWRERHFKSFACWRHYTLSKRKQKSDTIKLFRVSVCHSFTKYRLFVSLNLYNEGDGNGVQCYSSRVCSGSEWALNG